MDVSVIEFKVLRENEEVIGLSLVGVGESNAEAFCFSFPSALGSGQAEVVVEDSVIRFKHAGYRPESEGNIMLVSDGGEYAADIDSNDATILRQLLECDGPYEGHMLKCTHVHSFGHGFELRALAA